MRQYLIENNKELTEMLLAETLQDFQTRIVPSFQKLYNYYKGKQAILQRQASDSGKPCNKIVVNYCYNIVANYLGYIAGLPISYEGEDLDGIMDVLNYNDVKNEDSELLRLALIYGRSFEMNYVDAEGKQRFKVLDPRECIPIYNADLSQELRYVIRFYRENLVDESFVEKERYIVEVYDDKRIMKYRSTSGFSSFEFIDEQPHFFGMVPVTVFSLDSEQDSAFAQVITLQDAYNQLISDEVDDFDAFADAYLVLQGVVADEDDLAAMKEHRCLLLDADSNASYLTKNISDTQIANMLQNINDQIHKISNAPDFNDEKFLSASGIAMRYKLVGFENQASSIESEMKKALQRRIEIISKVEQMKDSEFVWRDVNIVFTRNLPVALSDTVDIISKLRGLVSTETLLSLLPFVKNPEEEMAKVYEENQAKLDLYRFDGEQEWQEKNIGNEEK